MEKEEVEKLTKEYQNIQMQIQNLTFQKMQFNQQKEEYKEAEKELQVSSGRVYSEIGGLIVETTKEKALKDLGDKMESVEMRLNIILKQYNEVNKREQSIRQTLTEEFKGEK